MFKLEKCLFVIKLETGGLVIGSIHLISYVILFLYCAAYLTIYDCSDFERLLQFPENRVCQFNRDFIVFNWLFLVTAAGLAFFCYNNCIKGIREKNFDLLRPFVLYLILVVILSIYDLFYCNLRGVIMALMKGIITGYMYMVVNSYYIWLRDGPKSKLVPLDLE